MNISCETGCTCTTHGCFSRQVIKDNTRALLRAFRIDVSLPGNAQNGEDLFAATAVLNTYVGRWGLGTQVRRQFVNGGLSCYSRKVAKREESKLSHWNSTVDTEQNQHQEEES